MQVITSLVLLLSFFICAWASELRGAYNRFSNDEQANNLPGIEIMRHAVNPWRWNPLQGKSNTGLGSAVFDFTYNRGEECVFEKFRLPDCVCDNADLQPSVEFNETAGHIHSAEEYQEYIAKSTDFSKSISFGFVNIVGSASEDFQEAGMFAASGSVDIICKKATARVSKLTISDLLSFDVIKPTKALVKHVEVLPIDFNATAYVNFLVLYATYIKSATLGGQLVECSYFTAASEAALAGFVSDTDMEATASESCWFSASDTKSASLQVSMECGKYQEYATGGRRVGVRGPPPSFNSNGDTWMQMVSKRPALTGVTLGPIVDLMTELLFPQVRNLSIIRSNVEQAYPYYCNITGECYTPPNPTNPTNEVVGVHPAPTGNWSALTPAQNSFCYLTNLQAMRYGTCYVTIGAYYPNDTTVYWQLAYAESTGNDAFKCGARCLTDISGVTTTNYPNCGTGTRSIQLIPVTTGVCVIQGTEILATTTEVYCHLYIDGDNWHLDGHGGESGYFCSADCMTGAGVDGSVAQPTEFPLLKGKGTVSQTLMPSNDYVCYLSYLSYIFLGGEHCYITEELAVGLIGNYWILHKQSDQDATSCGAICVSRAAFSFS